MRNLENLKWSGDLSLEDSDLLANYARRSKKILEFGSGGSTQIFSQLCKNVISVETSSSWVDIVKKRLYNISPDLLVTFKNYSDTIYEAFDLIFVDGITEKRLEFSLKHWHCLNYGGKILFHDTRKPQHKDILKSFIIYHIEEIDVINFNERASNNKESNITSIKKRKKLKYVNWQEVENKPIWSYGSDMTNFDVWEYKNQKDVDT